jgi:hypothetical protein
MKIAAISSQKEVAKINSSMLILKNSLRNSTTLLTRYNNTSRMKMDISLLGTLMISGQTKKDSCKRPPNYLRSRP